MIYDNIEDKDEVVALDSRANTVKARWPIAPSGGATAMDMDVQHRRLFIGGRNKVLAIMDADSGKVLQTFPIGDGVDTNIYEPETGLLFTATREGTLHIFHEDTPDKFSVVEIVKTEFGPATWRSITRRTDFSLTPGISPRCCTTAEQPKRNQPCFGTFRLLVYGR